MSNRQKTEVGGQGSEVGVHAQVYLRWVGVRNGEQFTAAGTGPWGVVIEGNTVLLDTADDVEIEHERNALEKFSHVSGLLLEVAEIRDGVLGEWKKMVNALRDVNAQNTKARIEKLHAEAHETPDVCDLRCLRVPGSVCGRPVCTGACKLPANIWKVAIEKKACPVDGEECDRCHGSRTTACDDAADMLGTITVGAECQKVNPIDAPAGALMDTPSWWTEEDTRMAMLSNDGHLSECHGQCEGDFRTCPLPGLNCVSVSHCRWCAWWESKDGVKGVCQDPAYDGERKRTTRADRNLCMNFCSRWSREEQTAEAEGIIEESDKRYRVVCLRHGDVGEETHYLRAFDNDGDITICFDDLPEKAWWGSLKKASVLADVVRGTTRDDTVRIEEVPHG